MNSDEYHAVRKDGDDTQQQVCHFCDRAWSDHEQACPYNGRDHTNEGRVYGELREGWQGP